MDAFATALLSVCAQYTGQRFAWCILPNHYHLLVEARPIAPLLHHLGRLHGRTSYHWNLEDNAPGRKVFYRSVERAMRTQRHFFATLNYVHHNPCHHRYTQRWQDWRWSSAAEYLEQVGPAEAKRVWHTYPLLNYGASWDAPEF